MDIILGIFNALPEMVNELVSSFLSTPIRGDLIFGYTQYTFWLFVAVVLLAVVFAVFVKKQSASLVPQGRFVNAVEFVVEYTRDNMVKAVVGKTWRTHFPFIATLFFFILVNNIVGIIPGCHPGTGTISVTAALAIVAFIYFIYVGIKKHGVLGYLKTFTHGLKGPMAAPIWLIELFSTFLRLITLAVRLFCNMFAGHIVMGTFAILTSVFAQQILTFAEQGAAAIAASGVSVVWELILIIIYAVELMVAVIQAFVFALLTAVYVQTSEEEI